MNWIKTSDRLPEEKEDVLIYVKKGAAIYGCQVSFYTSEKEGIIFRITAWEDRTCSVTYEIDEVTHWMPLPDKPKD